MNEKIKNIDKAILDIDKVISKNISKFDDSDRGLLSQNILAHLRNLVEYIFLKIYSKGNDIEINYDNIQKAKKYIKGKSSYNFLNKFYKLLKISVSHYTLDEDSSERLMLKYYEYLLKIKSFLKEKYNLDVFINIDKFPIDLDSTTQEYYEKIVEQIEKPLKGKLQNDRYYIQKIKPFFVDNKVYYEVTFTRSHDRVSKFDRVIAFTKHEISPNYAIKLFIRNSTIKILNKTMPISIIEDWEVSIRPCELNNFAKIFDFKINIQSSHQEYKRLMAFLTNSGLSLDEFIQLEDSYYNEIKYNIIKDIKSQFFDVLDQCRYLVKNNNPGENVIKYLLYKMNNKVIKQQYYHKNFNKHLSNLKLKYGCIPFDQIPFSTSLINHNPKFYDLLNCLNVENREDELFARYIKNNTEIEGILFTPQEEIKNFENIDQLIKAYNSKLYYRHENRSLNKYKDFIYIKGYRDDTIEIIKLLKALAFSGIKNYSKSVHDWLQNSGYQIDCNDKKEILINMFEKSKVAMIYGSAGTGKSTMINHISNFFNNSKKLYLANTNPAIDNLKRKVNAQNCKFMTITKFLSSKNSNVNFDLLFIDESSTVSNDDMLNVLRKASFKLIVLVGDVFQIESIRFGNWFNISREFLPKNVLFELTKPYRTTNNDLLELWNKVRNLDDDISEHLAKKNYTTKLDESIFKKHEEDEIILCLNYDGLYGINNINRFLQANNPNTAVYWGELVYKVNDPILFNDTKRFGPSIYNNLKGKIVFIEKKDDYIQFDIQIDKVLNETDIMDYNDIELIEDDANGKSTIRFKVNKYRSTDEDDESTDTIVPFQIAYAVSIHKAQGLEYDSVKIVITDEVEERITHNIFYTAITRAKKQLKIYWSPETENKILSRLKKIDNKRDAYLLKNVINE
ncbi:helicase [Marinitoga sp. 1137]|uniref:ATP-dependent DNA helicase n=1 Tax=Marinitoga sp. 1137 TaxID=1545835 RepID=UPI000950974E|nr:AAA family ATPase [Marinitoga sp. 1137]APT76051.1 helicase [Marinitoga sp. 1137]